MTSARDRNVPPSINEAMIARHFARDISTGETAPDAVLSRLFEAVRNARLASEKSKRVADAVLANEMKTLPARHRQVRDDCWRLLEPALKIVDAARTSAKSELSAIEQRTSSPPRPTDAAGAMLATEIRSRLASMKPAERSEALASAMTEGDDVVLGAVLNAPPMLSGLGSATELESLRASWRRVRHGADVDRAERLTRAMDDTDRAGVLALGFYQKLSSEDVVRVAEQAEAAVAEALAS